MLQIPGLQKLLRNLSLASTGVTVVVMTLISLESLNFLKVLQVPLVLSTGLCWVAYTAVRSMAGEKTGGRLLTTVEGPGEELVQKAIQTSFQKFDDYTPGEEAEQLFLEGEQLYETYHFPKAAEKYEASVDVRTTLPALINLSAALINTSDFKHAEEVIELGLLQAERLGKRDYRAACLANLGVVRHRLGRPGPAREACESALDLFRMGGDGRGQADVTLTMGNIHVHYGEEEEARAAYLSALQRYDATGHTIGRANARGNLGNLSMRQGDLEGALKNHRAALALHEEVGNPVGRANALSNIGNVRFRREDFEDAKKAYNAALELYRQMGVPLGEASVLGNVGNILFRQGKHDEALETYQSTLAIHIRIGNAIGRANTLTNMGSLLSRMGDRQAALQALHEARKIYAEMNARTAGSEAVLELIARVAGHREIPDRHDEDVAEDAPGSADVP
ncbi:MAG: tetratricopeptide repeat protein [Candidatus Latescibacterota bacterium]|nr:tetratricopeptide repeat protein [Candidatus Latescibacterota bacterium]